MDSTTNMVFQNFTVIKGDSLTFTITFEDSQIAPDDIIFTVKDKVSDTTPVIQKKLSEGDITRTQDEGFVYSIYLPYTDTEDLKLLNYIHQIEVIFGADHETVAQGKIIITPEV